MRINQAKRIFMNEADGGSGNGASVPTPPAPAAPTAAPTAPEQPAPSIVDQVASLIDTKLKAFENGFFANARRAGVLGKDKPSEPTPPPSPTPSAPSAQAGVTMADVDARLELERVIASREGRHGLSEAQTRRLRAALSGVARDALASEADSYLSDLGLVKANTPPPQPTVPTTPAPAAPAPAKPNLSDRGTAAPTDTRDSEGVLNSRPLEMTGHDVDALILKHGHEKGLQMYQERVLSALRGVRIKTPRG
jgi:hypothetical protein